LFQGHGVRILLVEDDNSLAGAVRSYLEWQKPLWWTWRPAWPTRAARCSRVQYAAVLLDLHLGDGEGLSLLPHVRALPERPIVIVVTARDQVTDRIRGLDAGADDYIVKPYDPGRTACPATRSRTAAQRQQLARCSNSAALEIDLAHDMVRKAGSARSRSRRKNGPCCA
jgi:two-component system OmpR family response regulator